MFEEEEKNQINPKKLPIYQKGKEIFEVVYTICELIPEEDDYLQQLKPILIEDASILSVKIAGAEATELFDLKMEAAAIIRMAARNLMVQNHTLEMFGFKDGEYFNIVRNLVEEYRLLFIDWVAKFDQWNYSIDRWGLFNPPGVGPHDKDPDDDIPFDPETYMK